MSRKVMEKATGLRQQFQLKKGLQNFDLLLRDSIPLKQLRSNTMELLGTERYQTTLQNIQVYVKIC